MAVGKNEPWGKRESNIIFHIILRLLHGKNIKGGKGEWKKISGQKIKLFKMGRGRKSCCMELYTPLYFIHSYFIKNK